LYYSTSSAQLAYHTRTFGSQWTIDWVCAAPFHKKFALEF
jgi:hypothetical protein